MVCRPIKEVKRQSEPQRGQSACMSKNKTIERMDLTVLRESAGQECAIFSALL